MSSTHTLLKQYAQLNKAPVQGFQLSLIDNSVHHWKVMLLAPPLSDYDGAIFTAKLVFPTTYPFLPPTFTFTGIVPFHPNIHTDGKVCISILHPPGDDPTRYPFVC